jgi:hypothetical protein
MNKLTKYEQELLETAFLIFARDMTYEQEAKIVEKMNASISDLYEIERKIENNRSPRT